MAAGCGAGPAQRLSDEALVRTCRADVGLPGCGFWAGAGRGKAGAARRGVSRLPGQLRRRRRGLGAVRRRAAGCCEAVAARQGSGCEACRRARQRPRPNPRKSDEGRDGTVHLRRCCCWPRRWPGPPSRSPRPQSAGARCLQSSARSSQISSRAGRSYRRSARDRLRAARSAGCRCRRNSGSRRASGSSAGSRSTPTSAG